MSEKRSKLLGIGIFLMFIMFIVEVLSLFFGAYVVVFILAPILTILCLILFSLMFMSKEWVWIGVDLFLDKKKELQQRFWKSGMSTFEAKPVKQKVPFGESEDGLDEISTDKTYHRISAGNRLSVLVQGMPESINLLDTFTPTVDPEIWAQEIKKAYEKGRLRNPIQEDKIMKKINMLAIVLFVVAGIVIAGIIANYLSSDFSLKAILEAIKAVGTQVTEKVVEL